jgi:MoxR-like ATPase
MAKKQEIPTTHQALRPHAEDQYRHELEALATFDKHPKPAQWMLSPWAVRTYLMGGKIDDITISTKYFGDARIMEVAIATLATDRALMLLGVPGTAKTWVSEHLSAAISGNSTLLVQGTAGMSEDALRYGWNYARLLSEGPSEAALTPSPVFSAMKTGSIVRIEELTRIPSDVQDTLITLLSEKALPIPELMTEVQAMKGFNLIATANDRDKGVNELSSALRRRFNTVYLPLPATLEAEVQIVQQRVTEMGASLQLSAKASPIDDIRRLVTIFRELRQGKTEDAREKIKSPSATLSTAEAISVIHQAQSLAVHFGNGVIQPKDLASSLTGAIIKDESQDKQIWLEYLETIVRKRPDWKDLYAACKENT